MMLNKAVRLYGKNDLRLEEFELREINDREILIKIISDSVCMSTYKTTLQGSEHIRVPDDISENPVIIGHEFCAEIVEVGERWKSDYKVGDKVVMPPVLSYRGGNETVGYSFEEIGGDSEYSIVYEDIIENGFLLKLNSDSFFNGSLIEPASCVLRGYKSTFHIHNDNYMPGLKKNGRTAILAGCGPMGLEAIDIALHTDVKPSLLVVTDINKERIEYAKSVFSAEAAAKDGIELVFLNTSDKSELLKLTNNEGYDDVFVYAPVPQVVELGDKILGFDGCLNFFAGPLDKKFSAPLNFYNVHYAQHHVAGTSGSTAENMRDIVALIGQRRINPAVMITHIGGMNAVIDTTLNLPKIPRGKKLIYTHIDMPLTAITDFKEMGKKDKRFGELYEIIKDNNGLWCARAEEYLLNNF